MTWIWRLTVAAVVWLGYVGVPSAQETAVQLAEAEWARAIVAADRPALDALYADDLVYVHSNGAVDSKTQWLTAIGSGRIDFSELTVRESQVRHYGDATVVNALYDAVLNTRRMAIQYLTVYVNQGGDWQIVTQQTAILPDSVE